jgi:P pilus assembly chaperone PapD
MASSSEAARALSMMVTKERSISVDNPDATPYLIQSWIENERGQSDKQSFIVTPPFRLDGSQKNTLRILKMAPDFAADQETMITG